MPGIELFNGVINYGGVPSAGAGLLANRPAFGVAGRLYIGTDTNAWYRDTGTAWVTISAGVSGSAATGQATFWSSASTISGDNAFFWDNTNKRLGLGTATPGVRLDVHGTGIIQQLNGTGTANSYLDFQNAGSTQWRIGNFYNGALQQFSIFNAAGSLNVLTILQSGAVGIGVTTPGYLLTIGGRLNVGAGGSNLGILFTDALATIPTNQIQCTIASLDTGTGFIAGSLFLQPRTGVGASLLLGTEGTPKISLSPSGNVGIGYTTSNLNLAVLGSIYQGNNTANALYEMFCNGNLYTGGISPTILTVGTNTTMVRTATGYRCTATLTLTLPAASGLNNMYYVVANTGATVTVQRNGTDTIVDKTGASVTSVTVAAGTRSMFYVSGGTEIFQIF